MSTSGAISGVAFSFSYALVKASSPTEFFTGSFTAGDVKVVKRTGGTTATSVPITTLPTHKYEGVFQFDLSASEMTADEVVVVINAASAADVVDEAISIVTETSTADVRKVAGSLVSGVADFKATGFSTFNPVSDTVANVTTVGSVSGSVGSVVAAVTAGTVSDKTGYSITGTLTTLDALDTAQDSQHSTTQSAISGLNDIAATDIVSGGAITTSGGAVSNVTLVATTTTNTDMRGTDNAASQTSVNTVDTEVGQIKAKTDQLTFTVANQVDANALTGASDATASNQTTIINHLTDVKGAGWTSTDNLAEITEDVTGLNGDAMRGTDGAYTGTPATAGDVADAVWDEALSGHNVGGSTGKALRQMKEGTITIESAINDTSATALSFVTDLTEPTTSYYSNKIMVFISGHLSGQARIITNYNGTTKAITLEEALTSAPADGDEFLILATHENSIGEIQAGLATSAALATVDANVDSILLDTNAILADTSTDGVVISTAQAEAIADEVLQRSVGNVEGATLSEHSLATIVLAILESQRVGSTWSIYRTDGTTVQASKTLTLDSSADPVTGVE